MKQLSDYCAMLEQSHAEINAYQKEKAASVKQTMRSEVDRYYQQVAQLQMRFVLCIIYSTIHTLTYA